MAETLTTKQAAKILGVHPVTMRKWRDKSSDIFGIMEDCQGLQWHYEHPRKIVYSVESVERLKRILQRRKIKQ